MAAIRPSPGGRSAQRSVLAIATTLGLRRSQLYAYASTALAGLAVILFWTAPATQPWVSSLYLAGVELTFVAAVSMAGLWLWAEIRSQKTTGDSFDPRPWLPRRACLIAATVPLHLLVRLTLAVDGLTTLARPKSA